MDEVKPPKSEKKPSPKKSAAKEPDYLIDWKKAAENIEAELKKKDWDKMKQRRNPRFIFGLVTKYIVGPLVRAINQQ